MHDAPFHQLTPPDQREFNIKPRLRAE